MKDKEVFEELKYKFEAIDGFTLKKNFDSVSAFWGSKLVFSIDNNHTIRYGYNHNGAWILNSIRVSSLFTLVADLDNGLILLYNEDPKDIEAFIALRLETPQ